MKINKFYYSNGVSSLKLYILVLVVRTYNQIKDQNVNKEKVIVITFTLKNPTPIHFFFFLQKSSCFCQTFSTKRFFRNSWTSMECLSILQNSCHSKYSMINDKQKKHVEKLQEANKNKNICRDFLVSYFSINKCNFYL